MDCIVVMSLSIRVMYFLIFFAVASLALGDRVVLLKLGRSQSSVFSGIFKSSVRFFYSPEDNFKGDAQDIENCHFKITAALPRGQWVICIDSLGPFHYHWLTLITAWITNHIHRKMWNEITSLFPNFSGCTIEIWEWIIPQYIMDVITYQ